jgi:hypothetical protein
MLKKILLFATLGVTLSGCFMAPMALIGPATSGWTSASIIQSGLGSGASYIVEKSTGKSISEHAFAAINKETTEILRQSYLPEHKAKDRSRHSKKKIRN